MKFERLAAISEKDIGHIMRDVHVKAKIDLNKIELLNLHQYITHPDAVYFDDKTSRLCYLSDPDKNSRSIVVVLRNAGELKKNAEPLSMLVTSYRVYYDNFIGSGKTKIK